MIINSIHLHNIRSYLDTIVEFPQGKFLLSGEVGSGKTTILLAIEFGLFGIMRGSLSGSDLLRHGTNEGSVKMLFTLEDNNYEIFRRLKRTSTGINQDTGYLSINGIKENFVHSELKTKILEILGYPKSLINKSKGLIFRYTTYTPQEEVKKIMYESPDVRLDTLRKVFNLDKYKIIRENTLLLIKQLKHDIEILKSKTLNEELLIQQLSDSKKLLIEFKNKSEILVEEIKKLSEKLSNHKKILIDLEKEKEEFNLLIINKEKLKNNILLLKNRSLDINNNLSSFKELILPEISEENSFKIRIEKLNNTYSDHKEKSEIASQKIAQIIAQINLLKKNEDILQLKICPTCKQEVNDNYKEKINKENNKLINTENKRLFELNIYSKKAKNNLDLINKKIQQIKESHQLNELNKEKLKIYNEKILQKKTLKNELLNIEEEITRLIKQEKLLNTKTFDKQKYELLKKDFEVINTELNNANILFATTKNEIFHKETKIKELNNKIEEIVKYKKQIKNLLKKNYWLKEFFNNTVNAIEKNVLLKLHNEFNSSFQEWFEMLISDDTITSRIDETFTPYIIQNGQKTTFENLSGGEKTSLALAYRLALNKVINDYMTTIHSRELLILDEPTDGFSANQLDKIRDVLEKLSSKQVILVSHEPKLESFVEEIIRVHKTSHVSHIL